MALIVGGMLIGNGLRGITTDMRFGFGDTVVLLGGIVIAAIAII